MRSVHRAALAAVAAGALALSGTAGAKEFYKMGTLGPGTSPNLTMTTMATIINQALDDVEIQVNATGAATKHAIDAGRGELDLYMSAPVIHKFLVEGKAMYAKIKDHKEIADKARLVFWFPIGVYHVTVYADSGIETLEGIKGKKVFLGPPGGGATNTMTAWVKAVTGYQPGKDFDTVKLGWQAAAQAFQDRQIDVYINPTNAPSPVIEQMALTSKLRFLGPTGAQLEAEAVKGQYTRPGRFLGVIPKGTYGANHMNDADVPTLGAIVGVVATDRMPADTMYRMTKAFWEGIDALGDAAPWTRNISLDRALMAGNIPLHPGAYKYYREIGATVPQMNLPPTD